MPYYHRKEGSKQCVYKKEDNSKVGCTSGSVEKYLAALHANANESVEPNAIKGGLADNKSIHDLVVHHGDESWASIQFESLEKQLEAQLEKGIKIEKEHTSDEAIAREIAIDHLWEDPKYYDKLEKVEESLSIIKKLLRENIDLHVTKKTSESISILAQYNNKNAGIIVVRPSLEAEDTLEIVNIKFKKEYDDLYVILHAVKSLWRLFKDVNHIIISPELESVQFWNKIGFTRISPHFLILNRGH